MNRKYATKIETLDQILDGRIGHGFVTGWIDNIVLDENGNLKFDGLKKQNRVGRFKVANGILYFSKKGGRKFDRYIPKFESAIIEKIVR